MNKQENVLLQLVHADGMDEVEIPIETYAVIEVAANEEGITVEQMFIKILESFINEEK